MDFTIKFLTILSFAVYFDLFSTADVVIFNSDPAPIGFCFMKKHNIYFRVDEILTKVDGKCNQYQCKYPIIRYDGCGFTSIVTPQGRTCFAANDLSKPYPDCCFSDKCIN